MTHYFHTFRDVVLNKADILCLEEELHLVHQQKTALVNAKFKCVQGINKKPNTVLTEMTEVGFAQKAGLERAASIRLHAAHNLMRGLSHEIKNPLAGIRGVAQLAARNAQGGNIDEYTDIIIREVDRVNQLLEKMSSAKLAPQKEDVSIDVLLVNCLKLVEAEYGDSVLLKLDCDASLPKLDIDPGQITQVVLNLLQNAAHFSLRNNKPSITVTTRLIGAKVSVYLDGKKGIQISVEDNGNGVAEELVEQLFFPMVSARDGGSGLGLAISQEIARNHGGIIDHQSTKIGTCFSLYLPLSEPL